MKMDIPNSFIDFAVSRPNVRVRNNSGRRDFATRKVLHTTPASNLFRIPNSTQFSRYNCRLEASIKIQVEGEI